MRIIDYSDFQPPERVIIGFLELISLKIAIFAN